MPRKKEDTETYEVFHGKPPRGVIKLEVDTLKGFPKNLIFLGEAIQIVYKCNKVHGGGDGRMAMYKHKFSKGTLVCTDKKMKQLYIVGKKLKVTSAGIEN
jgi:hypothetical protein